MSPHMPAKWIFVLLASACSVLGQTPPPGGARPLDVIVLDQSRLPVPGAEVEIALGNQSIATVFSDQSGRTVFPLPKPGRYTIRVSKAGFETAAVPDFAWDEAAPASLEVTLMAAGTKESIEVHAEASAVDTAAAAPGASISADAVKAVPSRPATVADALPLIPAVVRQPGGALQLSGTGEHRNAMLVNSADVTDPATGEFGLTVPIDIVESVNYYQTPFLAEYGRFSSGVVSVDTKRGGEEWKWELNDPLPEFNIRSWHMRGLRTATPRLNVEGPILPGKLYFSQGFDYEMRKTPVFTLPFPFNQKKTAGFNSFTQIDWIASARNLLTASVHLAPQRLQFVNLNYYTPQPTTPDANTSNYTATVSDKWSVLGGIWENTVSATRFHASVWPKGDADYVIQPQIDSGNYFAQQHHNGKRVSLSSSFAFAERKGWGTHNLKAGFYLSRSVEDGLMTEHPVDIENTAGRTFGEDCVPAWRAIPQPRYRSRHVRPGPLDSESTPVVGSRIAHRDSNHFGDLALCSSRRYRVESLPAHRYSCSRGGRSLLRSRSPGRVFLRPVPGTRGHLLRRCRCNFRGTVHVYQRVGRSRLPQEV